jgi:hypothetical protein
VMFSPGETIITKVTITFGRDWTLQLLTLDGGQDLYQCMYTVVIHTTLTIIQSSYQLRVNNKEGMQGVLTTF